MELTEKDINLLHTNAKTVAEFVYTNNPSGFYTALYKYIHSTPDLFKMYGTRFKAIKLPTAKDLGSARFVISQLVATNSIKSSDLAELLASVPYNKTAPNMTSDESTWDSLSIKVGDIKSLVSQNIQLG